MRERNSLILFLVSHLATGSLLIAQEWNWRNTSAQDAVHEAWVAQYNGPGNDLDVAGDLAVDKWGRLYVSGASKGVGTWYDWATIKYDGAGNELWVARYNETGNSDDHPTAISDDHPTAIVVDDSGNLYVTGYVGFYPNYDLATIKYDSSGAEIWFARYSGPSESYDVARDIAMDDAGNIYVTGSSGVDPEYDFITIKYNSLGEEEWIARYDGPGFGEGWGQSIALDGLGNVYVTGPSWGSGTLSDYATVKYNAAGVEQWVARYNGPTNTSDLSVDIATDSAGNVCVTGSIGPDPLEDIATIKYDPNGVELWIRLYDGPAHANDNPYDLAMDGSGNIYVTGSSEAGDGSTDYLTIKYDADGNEQWAARYRTRGNGSDFSGALTLDASGNVYVTGQDHDDYATIKYDASGRERWVARYDGGGDGHDRPAAIALGDSGSVYVTGSIWSGMVSDYATIKYRQSELATVPCDSIDLFQARCQPGGAIQARVVLLNSTKYAGEEVILRVDTVSYVLPLVTNGLHSKAGVQIPGQGTGDHTVTLLCPADCFLPLTVACPARGEEEWFWDEVDAFAGALAAKKPASGIVLHDNFPNPFNPSTTFRYSLTAPGVVTLKVYNMLGQLVRTIVDEEQEEGYHEVLWDGLNQVGATVSSGVYIYRLTAGAFTDTKRMLLLK
jgi:hypothetical protein